MSVFSYLYAKRNDLGVQRYAAHISWMLFARLASMAVAFVATSYIARSLGPTLYGELSYAISFIALFSFIAALGIDQVLYREILLHPEKRNVFMGTALMLRIISGIAALVICVVAAILLGVSGISFILIVLLSTTFVFGASMLLGQEFQADAESKYPSLLAVGIALLLNILKIGAIALDLGVTALALVLVLEPICFLFGLTYLRYKRYGSLLKWRIDLGLTKTILIDALPLMFVSAFYMIYARIDQIFIRHMIDVTAVGYYDAAVRIVELWYFVPAIIITGLIPAIANAKRTNDELYKKRAKKLFGGIVVAAIIVAAINALFAEAFVSIVFGASFAAAAPVLILYVWSNVGNAIVHVTQQLLILEKMQKHILISALAGMLTNVILCIVLIPSYGMLGAAFASVVAYIIPFLILFFIPRSRALLIEILTS